MMLRPTTLVLALVASTLAWGEALDPPERIARLSYVEGQVAFQAAQEPMTSTLPDRPLMPEDRLVTETNGRAELALGTATVRLDERSELSIADLDATTVQLELASGTASVHLRELLENETFEIVTPNTAIALDGPGEYRVGFDGNSTTDLTVHTGVASVATAGGPVRVAAGQRVRLEGGAEYASLVAPQPADAFDDWVLDREVQVADAEPSRYGLRDGDEYGYDELDRYGEWYDEPNYGRVWMPSYGYGARDPFRHGHWERVGLHGRSWIHSSSWAFFTFHSGRWAFVNHLNRWCWVPERRIHARQFAQDTRPFGRPRSGARSQGDRSDSPRDIRSRSRDDDARRPVARTDVNSRYIDNEPRPTIRRGTASGEQPRRVTFARSPSSQQSSPRPAATAPQGGQPTMRPSNTRSSTAARPSSVYGTPQPP